MRKDAAAPSHTKRDGLPAGYERVRVRSAKRFGAASVAR